MNKNPRKNEALEEFKVEFKKQSKELEFISTKENRIGMIIRIVKRSMESIENNYSTTIMSIEKLSLKEYIDDEKVLRTLNKHFEAEILRLKNLWDSEIENELKKISNSN